MQYTKNFFSAVKIENCIRNKHLIFFKIFAQNIDFGYTLEPRRGGSKEYPQFMFRSKNYCYHLTKLLVSTGVYVRVRGLFINNVDFCCKTLTEHSMALKRVSCCFGIYVNQIKVR